MQLLFGPSRMQIRMMGKGWSEVKIFLEEMKLVPRLMLELRIEAL